MGLLAPLLAQHPDAIELHLAAASALLRQPGMAKQALAHAETACRLEPDNPTGWFSSALAHLRLGDQRRAAQVGQRAVELAPTHWASHYLLAHTLLGDRFSHHRAVEAAGRARAAAPNEPDAYVVSALVHLHSGARPDAEDRRLAAMYLAEALRLDPANVEARSGLGELELARRNPLGAAGIFRRSLRQEPTERSHVGDVTRAVISVALTAHLALWFSGALLRLSLRRAELGRPSSAILIGLAVAGLMSWTLGRVRRALGERSWALVRRAAVVDPFGVVFVLILPIVATCFVVAALVSAPLSLTMSSAGFIVLLVGVAAGFGRVVHQHWPRG